MRLTLALLAASVLFLGCGPPAQKQPPSSSEGERVYLLPAADGNSFACASCHALSEPAPDGLRRAGHPIGDATRRPSWKNGQVPSFLSAANSCLTEWMGASEWSETSPDYLALKQLLDSRTPALTAPAISFQIVPPVSVAGGDPVRGRALFNQSCALCHGVDGAGSIQGPNLAGARLSAEHVARRVRLSGATTSPVYAGLTGGRMPFWAADRLSDQELRDVSTYVASSERPDAGTVQPQADGGLVGLPDAGSGCGKTHPRIGWYATLSTLSHGVSGTVTLTDDCTLTFTRFNYDGNGIDVRAYGAKGGRYGAGFGFGPQLYRPGQPYSNATLSMTLPEGKTFDDFDGVSIWCVAAKVSFGDGRFRAP